MKALLRLSQGSLKARSRSTRTRGSLKAPYEGSLKALLRLAGGVPVLEANDSRGARQLEARVQDLQVLRRHAIIRVHEGKAHRLPTRFVLNLLALLALLVQKLKY
jgi:hypothetical protein